MTKRFTAANDEFEIQTAYKASEVCAIYHMTLDLIGSSDFMDPDTSNNSTKNEGLGGGNTPNTLRNSGRSPASYHDLTEAEKEDLIILGFLDHFL